MRPPDFEAYPEVVFYALGVAFLVVGVWHPFTEGSGVGPLLEGGIVIVLALIPIYVGYGVRDEVITDRGCRRAVDLTLAAMVGFALLAVAIAAIWALEGTPPGDAAFMVRFAGVLGAAAGSQASVSAVRSGEEYERAQQLNRLLKVNQRVLRHNLRNELAIALGHLDNLDDRIGENTDTEIARRHLEELLDVSERARRIVTVWETDDRTELSLSALVTDATERTRERFPDATIDVDVSTPCRIEAHPALGEAIEELVTNAIEHNPPDVSVTVTAVAENGTARIDVADDGVGLHRSDREAVFLNEETPLSHGRGLGLVFVYWTVRASHGEFSIGEIDEGGTVARLRLPVAR